MDELQEDLMRMLSAISNHKCIWPDKPFTLDELLLVVQSIRTEVIYQAYDLEVTKRECAALIKLLDGEK